jgi:hypothetical protein
VLSAGEVGVIFGVKDEASAALQRIADEFNRIQGIVDAVTAAIDKIGGADSGLGKLQEALGLTAKAGEDSARTITESFGKIDGSVDSSIQRVNALKTSFIEAAEASKAINVAAANIGGGGPHGGNSGPHGGGFAHHIEQMVGGALSGNFRTMAGGVGGLAGGAMGAAMSPAGMAAGFAGYEVFNSAADLAQARLLMQNQGASPEAIDAAQKQAMATSPNFGMSGAAMLKMMAEISQPLNQGTTGDTGLAAAREHIDTVAKAMTIMRSLKGEDGGNLDEEAFDLVKSAEFRNAIDPAKFDSAISSMARGSEASAGKVGPRRWFQAIKYARAAGMRADDDFLYSMGPELITEFNASGMGTAWSSLYQGVVAGKLTKPALQEMDKIGAFDQAGDGDVIRDKNGNILRVRPGAMGDISSTFAHNPYEGAQLLSGKIDAFLQKSEPTLSGDALKQKREDEISYIFGNRNAAQMMLTLSDQAARLGRGAMATTNAADLDHGFHNVVSNDPRFALNQFGASVSNLGATFGTAIMPNVTESLKQLGSAADAVSAKFKEIAAFQKAVDDKFKPASDFLNDVNQKVHDFGAMMRGEATTDHFQSDTMPHRPVSHSMAGPSGWSNMGTAIAPNVAVTANVNATLGGKVEAIFSGVTVQIDGLGGAIDAKIKAGFGSLIGALKSTSSNSAAGFDGRFMPQTPDSSAHGIGHN